MARNIVETLIGAVVLVVAIGFVIFAYNSAQLGKPWDKDSYRLFAKFERADGILVGSDVRVGGIKIGAVTETSLDSTSYLARIDMTLNNTVKLPKDSSAQIVSDGLLGAKYIAIVPGGDEAMLDPDEEIKFTQSSVNFETLIGKFMFSGGDKGNKAEEEASEEDKDSAAEPGMPEENKKPEQKMIPTL